MSSFNALAVGAPFFEYLDKQLMPVLSGIVNIIILITSLACNGIIIRMFNKRGVLAEPGFYHIVKQLVVVDILACIFVLIPTVITNFAGYVIFTEYGCYVHVFFQNLVYAAHMFSLVVFSIERMYYIRDHSGKHEHFFQSIAKIRASFMLVWFFAVLIGVSGVIPITTISFNENLYQCHINHESNFYYMLALCGVTFLLPLVIGLVAQCVASAGMAKQLEEEVQKSEKTPPAPENKADKRSSGADLKRSRRLANMKSTSRAEMTASVFDPDDNRNPHHNLCVTIAIIWLCTALFSIPYWTHWMCAFADYLNPPGPTMYRTTWMFSMFTLNITYCIKPLLLISHSRLVKSEVKKSYSKEFRSKVKAVVKKANDFIDKLDKLLFTPLGKAKAVANIVIAKRYAKLWIKKAREIQEERRKALALNVPDNANGAQGPYGGSHVINVTPSPVPSPFEPERNSPTNQSQTTTRDVELRDLNSRQY